MDVNPSAFARGAYSASCSSVPGSVAAFWSVTAMPAVVVSSMGRFSVTMGRTFTGRPARISAQSASASGGPTRSSVRKGRPVTVREGRAVSAGHGVSGRTNSNHASRGWPVFTQVNEADFAGPA
mgnify:CR=1 FL=1